MSARRKPKVPQPTPEQREALLDAARALLDPSASMLSKRLAASIVEVVSAKMRCAR